MILIDRETEPRTIMSLNSLEYFILVVYSSLSLSEGKFWIYHSNKICDKVAEHGDDSDRLWIVLKKFQPKN